LLNKLEAATTEGKAMTKYHWVRGYLRRNGTYVSPHWRTNPDGLKISNYSTKGNYNPYTGRKGTRSPY
jgi:hypothetical protein